MDFYYMIKKLSDDQVKELISFKIDELRYKSYQIPKRFIGVDCDINPSLSINGEIDFDSQTMWQGFIPEDVKIIYSFVKNEEGYTVNNGCYYYVDNYEYLYEFAEYIKGQDIKDEMDFLNHVYMFIDNYFYNLKTNYVHRKIMHSSLMDVNGKYIKTNKKHSFLDFKGSNNAECSEYSVIVQNILSIFDYQTIYFGGSVASPKGIGGHAFNFSIIENKPCIIDFTIPVNIYSWDGVLVGKSPFLGVINDFNPKTMTRHAIEHIPYDFSDYYMMEINKVLTMFPTNEERHYVIGNIEYYNELGKSLKKNN